MHTIVASLQICTPILSLITILSILIKPIREWVFGLSDIRDGERCLLRSEMLRIYYDCIDENKIRQHEYENFVLMYNAYKAMKGNSFIDKIYKEVQKMEVIT